ncbi:YitT family protein [Lentibacillus cibarius]|uniref:YitT family protein n=1 Tax=Lentibacillus cibarius TaxID=2583219 RepID=A0A5S3QHB4_9BACI|nr:YitT family protein [Lentibacillus cibarius]TMN21292.1 YitT family protein [Lentibacillus cibarius]
MLKKIAFILFGSVLVGIGINYFVIPNHLVDGGVIGLGLIAKYMLELKPGLTIIILSLPLYLFAWSHFRSYFYNGIHGLLTSAFFIDLFHPLMALETPPIFISSISGGLLLGTGIGLMLLAEASAGGSDLLALMLAKVTPLNVGVIILIIDSIVIVLGWFIIQETTFMYSALMVGMIGLTTSVITSLFSS